MNISGRYNVCPSLDLILARASSPDMRFINPAVCLKLEIHNRLSNYETFAMAKLKII